MASTVRTAALTYDAYLRLDHLLELQRPVARPPAHDELMFIVVHQVYELWFRVILHELTAARDAMAAGEVDRPAVLLARCHHVERQMLGSFDVLDTLSPQGFLEFRAALSSASGFQSTQFRDIETLSAGRNTRRRSRARAPLEPCLWAAFLALLARHGFDVDDPVSRQAALLRVARGGHRGLWRLAEGLIDHDQAWRLWRSRHAFLVERLLGSKPGTGGSDGVRFLRSRAYDHFFPELWEVRGYL